MKKHRNFNDYRKGFEECRSTMLDIVEHMKGDERRNWYNTGREAWDAFSDWLKERIKELRPTLPKLEIQTHPDRSRFEVTPLEFRSFNGKRFINGRTYDGPVYYFMDTRQIKKGTDSEPEFLIDSFDEWLKAHK